MLTEARTLLLETLEDVYIPEDPNAKRIRKIGGTEGRTGELEDYTEQELEFSVFIGYVDTDLEESNAGDRGSTYIRQAVYLEDVLEVGDRVEVLGEPDRYEVEAVGRIRVGAGLAFEATLRELERE